MTGFFQLETKPVSIQAFCGSTCQLLRGCHSPKMPVTGQGKLEILVVAEAPGEQEDKRNTQLIGQAGQLLRDVLKEHGIDLDRDCRKTNAVRCRPPNNRRPTRMEIAACASHIWDEIKVHSPKVILLLGQVAVESFLLSKMKKIGAIGRWRGLCIPDQKAGAWVCPTFHPAYILRAQMGREIRGRSSSDQSVEEMIFRQDIERALNMLRQPFPKAPEPVFESNWKETDVAIDYETTGLRPWGKGQRIVSVGVSNGEWTVSCEMTLDLARKWKSLLRNKRVGKIAHNIKFEHQWASHCLDTETVGWKWDTMLAAHQIDNRPGFCGLKFQTYVSLGVDDWAGRVSDDFKEDENGFNSLANSKPTPELLRYNALDAFYTARLYYQQRKMFK